MNIKLCLFFLFFLVKVSNNADFVLTVRFMNKVLKLGKLRIASVPQMQKTKRQRSQNNMVPVKPPHLYIFSQISSDLKLHVLQKSNYRPIKLMLYSYFSFMSLLHRSECLWMIRVLILTIKTFHKMRQVSTTFTFSLRAGDLTSETSAGKLRLGINLVSSGRCSR